MSFFKKLARKASRGLRKIAKPALRAGLASLTGGASEAALRAAKAIGAFNPKRGRTMPSVSTVALLDRQISNTAPMQPQSTVQAVAMPGGAPIPRNILGAGVRRVRSRVPRLTKAQKKALYSPELSNRQYAAYEAELAAQQPQSR